MCWRPHSHTDLGIVSLLACNTADEAFARESTVAHEDEPSVGHLTDTLSLEGKALADQLQSLPLLRKEGWTRNSGSGRRVARLHGVLISSPPGGCAGIGNVPFNSRSRSRTRRPKSRRRRWKGPRAPGLEEPRGRAMELAEATRAGGGCRSCHGRSHFVEHLERIRPRSGYEIEIREGEGNGHLILAVHYFDVNS